MTLLLAKTVNERLYPPPIGRFTLFQNRMIFIVFLRPRMISQPGGAVPRATGGMECRGSTRAIRAAERLPDGVSPAASLSCVNPLCEEFFVPAMGVFAFQTLAAISLVYCCASNIRITACPADAVVGGDNKVVGPG